MNKKTAPKKTKKPDPKAAGERALNQRKIAMEEEELRVRRIVSEMLGPAHERITALKKRVDDQVVIIEEYRSNTVKALLQDIMKQPWAHSEICIAIGEIAAEHGIQLP